MTEAAPTQDFSQYLEAPLLQRSPKPLEGQWTIITGATRPNGLGFAIAERLALEGASIVIIGTTNSQEIAPLVVQRLQTYGVQAHSLVGDVTMRQSCVEMVTEGYKLAKGNVNILVNNAATRRDKAVIAITDEDYDYVYNPKARGALYMCQEWFRIRNVRNLRGGRIVNIGSSVGSLYGNYGQAHYAMANGSISGLTHALALELGTRDITVNLVDPTFIPGTEMTNDMEEQIPLIQATTPNNQLPTAQEVAGAVAYLVGPDGAHINDIVIPVDNAMKSNYTALRPLGRADFLVEGHV